jgi:acid phosphatase family membrane protein YuiD
MMEQKISIAVVVKVIVFVCSILGVWYNTKYQVDSLNEKVYDLKSQSKNFNIEVIKNDVKYNRIHIDKLEKELEKKKNKN